MQTIITAALGGTHTLAANESHWASLSRAELADLGAIARRILDVPPDLPASQSARAGLARALASVRGLPEQLKRVLEALPYFGAESGWAESVGTTLVPLRGRKESHLLYAIAIEVGQTRHDSTLDEHALQIFGAWLVRRFYERWLPKKGKLALVRAVLKHRDGERAGYWSPRSRARLLASAMHGWEAWNGRSSPHKQLKQSKSGNEEPSIHAMFSKKFRRRSLNLEEFVDEHSRTGAAGHGITTEATAWEAGRGLLAELQCGNGRAAIDMMCIETRLTSDLLALLPVSVDGQPPADALAWVDLTNGCFYRHIIGRIEKGARPKEGTESCYQTTGKVVRVGLTPPLHDFLLQRVGGQRIEQLGQLFNEGINGSGRQCLLGRTVQKVSVPCLSRSIPCILLQKGGHRWTIALAWNEMGLVSRGRSAYGSVPARLVHKARHDAHTLLGWPLYGYKDDAESLIGSYVTPTDEAVSSACAVLCERADMYPNVELASEDECVGLLNATASWLCYVACLGLALRTRTTYAIPLAQLCSERILINDKSGHIIDDSPVPVPAILSSGTKCWMALCRRIQQRLESICDPRSEVVARQIDERLADPAHATIFQLGPDGLAYEAGAAAWQDALPPALRLVGNFGRHYWAGRMTERGVPQRLIDIFLRHQLAGLHVGSEVSEINEHDAFERLSRCTTEVIQALGLSMPRHLLSAGGQQ